MNVLVVQRQSLVARVDFSLSVYARIIEAMDWLRDQGLVQYVCCGEAEESLYPMLRWADAVVFSKFLSGRSLAFADRAREAGRVTLLDIDDLVTAFPGYSNGAAVREAEFAAMLASVDRVTVANAHLLETLRPLRGDCVLAPNGIYAEKYPEPAAAEARPPRYVFTNADSLKISAFKADFIRLLTDFHAAHPEAALDFFGDPFPELVSLPFVHYTNRIPYAAYIRRLAAAGYWFAVTPLGSREDEASAAFNRHKNPFKFLNYGIAGVPCVYSNADIYADCVENGRTGLLVENAYQAWLAAMNDIFADSALRAKIRRNCRRKIREEYHIRPAAELFLGLLERG